MALTLLYGETEASLLSALEQARGDFKKGKALINSGSGDVQAAHQIQANARQRIDEIQRALYELDSETYADFANVGHSQTVATFGSVNASASEDS